MFPIMLNIRGRKCTVAGGGNVAVKQVRNVIKHKCINLFIFIIISLSGSHWFV